MLARFFIDRPVFAWVIAILIMLGGALALKKLPVTAYPAVAPPAIAFNVSYPGASPQQVEDTVISLIEQEMNGIEQLLYMEATTEAGRGTLTLTFEPGTNIDLASVEAQNRYKRAEARLPEDVRRAGVVVSKPQRNYLMFISLYSPDHSHSNIDLGSFVAARVLNPIQRIPGVGEAILFGTEYSMRIWLDPAKLQAYKLAPGDIANAIAAQNSQLAVGELGQAPAPAGQQLNTLIVTKGRLKSVEEFGNVVVRTQANGASLRVKDVARVEMGAQDYNVFVRLDRQPAASIAIRVAPGGNALEVARQVRSQMQELARFFPKGMAWEIPYDTSQFVEISIQEVVHTLFVAMLLVFLVIFIFLENLRATLVPAIVVPVALLGAVSGLYALGYTINVLTLFAMVLAIGIVVDDAIVIVENVERIMHEEQLSPLQATRKAMQQILGAIIGITLVLSAVFVPMAFFGGSVGVIYRQFAVTLLLSMAFSALMALTLTPAMCATVLRQQAHGRDASKRAGMGGRVWQALRHSLQWFFARFDVFFAWLSSSYLRLATLTLQWRRLALSLYGLIIVATGGLLWKLPGGFLPNEDQGYFIGVIQLPAGATQERTLSVLKQAEDFYLSQPEVAHVVGVVGFSFFGRGQNAAINFVRLKDWDARIGQEHSADAVVKRANMAFFRIKEAFMFATNVPPIPELGAIGGFDFRLQDLSGQGRAKLFEARGLALGLAAQNQALAGVRPESQEPGPQLLLDIDKVKAESLGISTAALNQTLQTAMGGLYINDFERNGRILRVQMQLDPRLRKTPEELLRLPIKSARGVMVPLAEIAQPRWIVGLPKLDRYNGNPAVKISGNPGTGRSTGEAMQAMEEISRQLPPGFGFSWSGTSLEEKLSGSQAPVLFAISLLVVFLVLAALYESWAIPLAVILVVPLGIFGAVLAVTLRGQGLTNDVFFKVGLIAIIGLSAKNAILIIEYARRLRSEGQELTAAALEACRLRFRPILMTSLAFILGVMPLAISSGAGAASRHAIGTGVIGGMIGATLLAIFLVPVFFVVVMRQAEKFAAWRGRHQDNPAELPHV